MNDSQIQSEISGQKEADDRLHEDRTTSYYIKDILDKNDQNKICRSIDKQFFLHQIFCTHLNY